MKDRDYHMLKVDDEMDELLERVAALVKNGTRKKLPAGKQRIAKHLMIAGARYYKLIEEQEAA